MTKKEIVSLSIKLAGIYCLIVAISQLGYTIPFVISSFRRQDFWSMLTSISTYISLLVFLIPLVFLLLFALYLIFSDKPPSKIASSLVQEEKTISFTLQDIQVLAFSIIGVWLLAVAIPALFRPVIQLIIVRSTSQGPVSIFRNSYFIPQILAAVFKIALGIYLFSGGKGLIKLWQRLQSKTDVMPAD